MGQVLGCMSRNRGDTSRATQLAYASPADAAAADKISACKTSRPPFDCWYYPPEIANDLQGVEISARRKAEIFACAWEYSRCVIPQRTNWTRYVAFMRIIIIGIIAEFRGDLVDVTAGDQILGYDLSAVLGALFEGTPGHVEMAREYRSFLLITADKASSRRNGKLFRRYVSALAQSPKGWFRMRDCDALARFTIASALACNDLDSVWFTNAEFEILTEIGDTLYDAVAFYKHRSERETNSTFAYMPEDLRVEAFQKYREILWALDVAWSRKPELQCVLNFTRFFGGPIHMMMRRYRFVEENLTIGRRETEEVITQTRQNFKLWNRVGAGQDCAEEAQRYENLVAQSDKLMFAGLADMLEKSGDGHCDRCHDAPRVEVAHRFGGVQLCNECRRKWREYLECFPARAAAVFPELRILKRE
jgi:hypothetical protein